MKLMSFGIILFLIGAAMADSSNPIVPAVLMITGLILMFVGGTYAGVI